MSRIDRIRHTALVRRAYKAEADRETGAAGGANLPVPVAPVTPPRTFKDEHRRGHSELSAQLMGQIGERRGLRAGAPLLDTAREAYNRTEWSGRYDRRARKGRQTRTEI